MFVIEEEGSTIKEILEEIRIKTWAVCSVCGKHTWMLKGETKPLCVLHKRLKLH